MASLGGYGYQIGKLVKLGYGPAIDLKQNSSVYQDDVSYQAAAKNIIDEYKASIEKDDTQKDDITEARTPVEEKSNIFYFKEPITGELVEVWPDEPAFKEYKDYCANCEYMDNEQMLGTIYKQKTGKNISDTDKKELFRYYKGVNKNELK